MVFETDTCKEKKKQGKKGAKAAPAKKEDVGDKAKKAKTKMDAIGKLLRKEMKEEEKQKAKAVLMMEEDVGEEIWDLVHAIPTTMRNSFLKCSSLSCDGCQNQAVAAWASNKKPRDLFYYCEGCQEADFGGWPGKLQEETEEEHKEEDESEGEEETETETDDEMEEIYEIVCLIPKNEQSTTPCDICEHGKAVATWAANLEERWNYCEECTEEEFGGRVMEILVKEEETFDFCGNLEPEVGDDFVLL